ncbi:MAG: hypothetical protein MUE44_18640 [Oscillatoriaceae cyanobacterium Prado104]|jgi:aminoglycoside phosphotransferase family enzyme|nr:hypothetical protein [Oscillatoriaceae cyanobacterium Prado104]
MRQLPDEKQLLELLELAKIVERQMIEVGQVIAAVDDRTAKRISEFREASLQNKEASGV